MTPGQFFVCLTIRCPEVRQNWKLKMLKENYCNYELLNRKEAASYLGITDGTLAVWACTGRYNLPFVKVGRLVKYRKSDLDAFINGRVSNKFKD